MLRRLVLVRWSNEDAPADSAQPAASVHDQVDRRATVAGERPWTDVNETETETEAPSTANTLSNNADQRSPGFTTVRDLG